MMMIIYARFTNCQTKKGGQNHRGSRAEKVARKLVESVLHGKLRSYQDLQGAHGGATVDYRHGSRRNHTGVSFCVSVGEVDRSIVHRSMVHRLCHRTDLKLWLSSGEKNRSSGTFLAQR